MLTSQQHIPPHCKGTRVSLQISNMPKLMNMAVLASVTALTLIVSSDGTFAQTAGARQSMERCVERVLSQAARTKTPDAQVGQAVVSKCDGPLRAALQSAI